MCFQACGLALDVYTYPMDNLVGTAITFTIRPSYRPKSDHHIYQLLCMNTQAVESSQF